MSMVVVVGNPKPNSRTREAAILVAQKLCGRAPDRVIDVVTMGAGLMGFGDPVVTEAMQAVQAAKVIVVASPTFKATYSGVLKLFLDQFPTDGLAGVTALPVMMGAGPAHAMAPDFLLKPVLVEMGATCPVAGLYLIDKTYAEDPKLDAWVARAKPLLP